MSLNLKDIRWEEFKNPPKTARPMVRWWWTGLDVEKEELVKEVQELDETGFLGAEIQVFMIGSPSYLENLDKERALRSHRFMQPYYYLCIKTILEEASKKGMIIDLTIGSSWPTGGTHISKEESMKTLLIGEQTIEGPFHYSGDLPKIIRPPNLGHYKKVNFENNLKLEAIIAAKPTGEPGRIDYNNVQTAFLDIDSILDLTEKVTPKGNLEWDVPIGLWQIFVFYSSPSGARPLLDCRSSLEKDSLVLDHLSSKSIRKHLDAHIGMGKKYFSKHFGKTLRAIFTDSLELSSDWLWTDDFFKQFKKKRGYDLKKFLPICFVPNRDNTYRNSRLGGDTPTFDFEDGSGERIRYDLELTISDLFLEQYVQTITEWTSKNRLKNRIQAYGIRADTIRAYSISDIPETEQLYAGGIIDFLKFAGSAGLIYEKRLITAEYSVWNQRDYLTTPLKMKVAADRLFISGINQLIYHGFPYDNPSFPYPGYSGFSTPYLPRIVNYSSNFNRNNPFWEFFPIINDYITRCQFVLQRGRTKSSILIYYPLFNYNDSVLKQEELVGGYLDDDDTPIKKDQVGGNLKEWEKFDINDKWTLFMLSLTDILTRKGYFYTHINEIGILESIGKNNKLIIGQSKFDVLILLNIEKISLKLAVKLQNLANEGIRILFLKKLPLLQNGFLNYKENDEKIETLINNLINLGYAYYLKDINEVPEFLRTELNINPTLIFEEDQSTIHYIHKKTKKSDYFFLRHSTNQPKEVIVKFPIWNKIPFILDPWTGDVKQATQYEKLENSIKMNLYFEAYGSKLIEFRKFREKVHIIKSPIKTERRDKKIIGYTNTPGAIMTVLSDNTKKIIEISDKLPSSIPIKNWHLNTKLRDHLGNIEPIEMNLTELRDWRQIPELQFCSSRSLYSSKFNLEKIHTCENIKLLLSLGRVYDVAIVKVNGNELKPLLVHPYEIDISNYVKIGENIVEIEIVPTLRNRLVGYAKKGVQNWKNHRKKDLAPSGLLGPVVIKPIRLININ